MTSEQFAFWLQGFVELNGSEPTAEQWQSIKDHLKTVFVKVTPDRVVGPVTISPALSPSAQEELERFAKRHSQIPTTGWPFGIGKEPVITC